MIRKNIFLFIFFTSQHSKTEAFFRQMGGVKTLTAFISVIIDFSCFIFLVRDHKSHVLMGIFFSVTKMRSNPSRAKKNIFLTPEPALLLLFFQKKIPITRRDFHTRWWYQISKKLNLRDKITHFSFFAPVCSFFCQ